MSCRGYCSTPASRYIDFHIKSCMHSATSTLRDTSHVIRNLANIQGRLAADCYLITADVESVYTNMDWDDTIGALNVYLTECTHPLKELLLSLVRFVLCNNFFQYDEFLYHQERGMAMRTPMAINIANSFLFVHEWKTFSLLHALIAFFGRFIDDLIWILVKLNNLPAIKRNIYSKLKTITLTWSEPAKSVDFLDLSISLTEDSPFSFSTF